MNRVRFSSEPPYLPGREPGGEELVEQVSMALLDIHEVEADPVGQTGGLGVTVLEPVELVVGEERIVRTDRASRDLVGDRPGIQERVVLGQERALVGVTARVGEL